jgi:DNA processing protein
MISENTKSLLMYRYLKGVGKKYLNDLALLSKKTGEPVKECFNAYKFKPNKYSNDDIQVAQKKANEQCHTAMVMGHKIISILDKEYPESLIAIKDAPPLLFCSGDINLLNKNIITIIGTREPTQHGISIAQKVTEWFTSENWAVASGLAKGVDTIAHETCLYNKGKTIAILAHGLEKVYPAQNKQLAKEIVTSGGLLITEYSYNSFVGRSNFVERDRIQAAIAKAVVLIQSDLSGGSLHASRAIIEYGRYLIVVGQSKKDIGNHEKKISANMLLAFGTIIEKKKLLKTEESNLSRLLIMPNKEYLSEVNKKIKQIKFDEVGNSIGNNLSLF